MTDVAKSSTVEYSTVQYSSASYDKKKAAFPFVFFQVLGRMLECHLY